MQTIYLSSINSDYDKLKYGIFRNHRFERILDSQTYFSCPRQYDKLYDIKITTDYKLPIKDLDKIISTSRNNSRFEKIKNTYQYDFPYFNNLLKYCIFIEGGGRELISINGKKAFEEFINNDI